MKYVIVHYNTPELTIGLLGSLLKNGITSKEICDKLGIGRNVLQRNLTTRLRKIDKSKAEEVIRILKEYQLQGLSNNKKRSHV